MVSSTISSALRRQRRQQVQGHPPCCIACLWSVWDTWDPASDQNPDKELSEQELEGIISEALHDNPCSPVLGTVYWFWNRKQLSLPTSWKRDIQRNRWHGLGLLEWHHHPSFPFKTISEQKYKKDFTRTREVKIRLKSWCPAPLPNSGTSSLYHRHPGIPEGKRTENATDEHCRKTSDTV